MAATDPQVLVNNAKCYACIPTGDRLPILISLFAQIANGLSPNLGELVIDSNAAALTMTNQNQYYPITTGWTAGVSNKMTANPVPGSMQAITAGFYETLASIAFTSSAAPQTIVFGVFKNGVLIQDHIAVSWTDTTTYPNTVSIVGIDSLVVGDVLDLRVQCTTAAGIAITVTNANFNCFLIPGSSI